MRGVYWIVVCFRLLSFIILLTFDEIYAQVAFNIKMTGKTSKCYTVLSSLTKVTPIAECITALTTERRTNL